MRTKLVLGAALLAAGLASSMAQVYSLNVVGYVNQTVQAGKWYMWGNPLSAPTNTTAGVLSGLSGNASDWELSTVYAWHGGWGDADTYVGGLGWSPGTVAIAPGTGFFFYATTNGTVTFVGEVGTTNDFTLPTGWSCIASTFPVQTNLVSLGLIGKDDGAGRNDFVYRYNNGYNDGDTYVGGLGWSGTGPDVNGPVLNVGEGIFYNNAQTTTTTWTKVFTIEP